MSQPIRCDCCRRPVPPGEARVSRRALRQVLCASCRDRGQVADPDHEREGVLETEVVPRGGYGLWEATVRTATGTFEGFGFTAQRALSSACRRAGVSR